MRIKGKGGRSLWRFNFGYSPNTKVLEVEGGTLEDLLTILGGLEPLTRLSTQSFLGLKINLQMP